MCLPQPPWQVGPVAWASPALPTPVAPAPRGAAELEAVTTEAFTAPGDAMKEATSASQGLPWLR